MNMIRNFKDLTEGVQNQLRLQYNENGFVPLENIINTEVIGRLNNKLETIINSMLKKPSNLEKKSPMTEERKELVQKPDKQPNRKDILKIFEIKAKGKRKVCQWVNIWKADEEFRDFVQSRDLVSLVSEVVGFPVRVAQDQLWLKPPFSSPLVFHRDSPYFYFNDPRVVTVWIPLSDMEKEMGPIEYVKKSHLWKKPKEKVYEKDGNLSNNGTVAKKFFEEDIYKVMLRAAEENGIEKGLEELEIVSMDKMKIGGMTIHNGDTWHGSKENTTSKVRKGIGIHFVHRDVSFTEKAKFSKLWRSYCFDEQNNFNPNLDEIYFPLHS